MAHKRSLDSPNKSVKEKRESLKSHLTCESFKHLDLKFTFSKSISTSSPMKGVKKKVEKNDANRISDYLVQKVSVILESVGTHEFNIFELDEYIGKKCMYYVATSVFNSLELESLYEKEKFTNFITEIANGYNREVDYHNDLHACDVFQVSYVMISQGNLKVKLKLHDIDIFAVLLAAI